jgi:hypothetical protein
VDLTSGTVNFPRRTLSIVRQFNSRDGRHV